MFSGIAWKSWKGVVAAVLGAGVMVGSGALSGCGPSEYERQRPPLDEVVEGDRGLQSKDVRAAADQIVMKLLSLRELNESPRQWTLVIDRIEDRTIDHKFRLDYDIFIEALRVSLNEQADGRIRLIENRERFYGLRSKELEIEGEAFDEFEQGGEDGGGEGGTAPGAPEARSPDFALYGKAFDLPNRATNYYSIQFDVVNLRTREQVFARAYEVRTSRSG